MTAGQDGTSWRIPAHGDYQAQVGLERKEWLDKTITALMIEPNEDTRKNTYKELLAYIHEQGVYVPLSYSRTKAVHVPALKGVTFCITADAGKITGIPPFFMTAST